MRKITKKNTHGISNGLTVIAIFVMFLILLPKLEELVVPCLRYNPLASYSDSSCTLNLALNGYLIVALSMFCLLSMVFWIYLTIYRGKIRLFRSSIILFALTTLTMAISLIIAFHLFIPYAEHAIRRAPILLEPLTP